MEIFLKEELDKRNRFTSLNDGNLFWVKANYSGSIKIPLSLLTKEQIIQLTKYLESNNLKYNEFSNSTDSRLVWEYLWGSRPEIIVDCIKLDYKQKQILSQKKEKDYLKNDTRVNFELGEILKLQNDFNSGKENWSVVYEKLSNLKGKAWTTKSWKIKRETLIKKSCESCGSIDNGIVLQHIKQPRKPETVLKQYKKNYREDFEFWLKNNPITIDISTYPTDTPSCPKCNSQTIRYRKTMNRWICVSTIKGIKCGYEFNEPIYKISDSKIFLLEKAALKEKFNEFLVANELYKNLIDECFSDLLSYLNMEDTITLCKKCAFLEDKHRI